MKRGKKPVYVIRLPNYNSNSLLLTNASTGREIPETGGAAVTVLARDARHTLALARGVVALFGLGRDRAVAGRAALARLEAPVLHLTAVTFVADHAWLAHAEACVTITALHANCVAQAN